MLLYSDILFYYKHKLTFLDTSTEEIMCLLFIYTVKSF